MKARKPSRLVPARRALTGSDGLLGRNRDCLHEEVTSDEVGQVGPPLWVKLGLIKSLWKEQFEGDEHQSHGNQVKQQPVEADVHGGAVHISSLYASAPKRKGKAGE